MTVTAREKYVEVRQALSQAEIEEAAFEADCLLNDIGGVPQARFSEQMLSAERQAAVNTAVARRIGGEPLQYVLGHWDFWDMTLSVGRGVLIPRPETELLCEVAAAHIVNDADVLDLCAGSGCVGLGIVRQRPSARLTFGELSEEALVYLRKNAAVYAPQARIWQTDVLQGPKNDERFDVIVSNPPYIETAQLSTLQREVQREPRMALDGGEDGLRFYRCLARDWTATLKEGGLLAVEVGIGQASLVAELWEEAGLTSVKIHRDAFGIDRVVAGAACGNGSGVLSI